MNVTTTAEDQHHLCSPASNESCYDRSSPSACVQNSVPGDAGGEQVVTSTSDPSLIGSSDETKNAFTGQRDATQPGDGQLSSPEREDNQIKGSIVGDSAMSTTSSEALNNRRLRQGAVPSAAAATDQTNNQSSTTSTGSVEEKSESESLNDMVARAKISSESVGNTASGSSNCNRSVTSTVRVDDDLAPTNTTNENHKIILKLPKTRSNRDKNDDAESQGMDHGSLGPHGVANSSSNSCHSNSSSGLSGGEPLDDEQHPQAEQQKETRKVEPLKINLNSHHNLHHHPVQKITIKPIVNMAADVTGASSDGSSSTEDDGVMGNSMITLSSPNSPKLKMTIKTTGAGGNVSDISEAHIVPKLTIRSTAKEEDGTPHSSIVPKLTIKISDSNQTAVHNDNGQAVAIGPPPPLPKLTIKTSLDGTSESIISSVSPALSTSSSSSLTSSLSSTSYQVGGSAVKLNDALSDSNKIPKLTIKTGRQDQHAVIITTTQHNETMSSQTPPIPKLTIKTKSVDLEESVEDVSLCSEKIPKITIKTNDNQTYERQSSPKFCIKSTPSQIDAVTPAIPKLTISVSNLDSGGSSQMSPKQCPLKVRQISSTLSLGVTGKTESADRIPKLMISRQESGSQANNCEDVLLDKVVPKLTIKTNSTDYSEIKESKFTIKQNASPSSAKEEKIPKLTITSIPSMPSADSNQQQTSEESDDCQSVESFTSIQQKELVDEEKEEQIKFKQQPKTNKIVPKLTIKNLSSPKLQMKVVVKDTPVVHVNGGNDDVYNELRRFSEDMDIDEALLQHDPQVFNNLAGKFVDSNGELDQEEPTLKKHPKLTHIVDTVDLTSSPSPGSSPAHFNYTDADPRIPDELIEKTTQSLLMERLQRESTVTQTVEENPVSTSILLNQLTAPGKLPEPPPLQPKPSTTRCNPNSVKYPELTERLLANGAVPQLVSNTNSKTNTTARSSNDCKSNVETIIESIEILDTPEGSPRSSLDEAPARLESLYNTHSLDSDQQEDVFRRNNNNTVNNVQNHLGGKRNGGNLAHNTNSEVSPKKVRRLDDSHNKHTMATLTIFTNDNNSPTGSSGPTIITTSPTIIRTVVDESGTSSTVSHDSPRLQLHHRSRKQRHEHLLSVPMDEEEESLHVNASGHVTSLQDSNGGDTNSEAISTLSMQKRRGRPKKGSANTKIGSKVPDSPLANVPDKSADEENLVVEQPPISEKSLKSRRVQLLRKRLAIDMVDSEMPPITPPLTEEQNIGEIPADINVDQGNTPKREHRTLRQSRRSTTPNVRKTQYGDLSTKTNRKRLSTLVSASASAPTPSTTSSSSSNGTMENLLCTLNHFGGSNSSLSSACSSSSICSTTITTTATVSGSHQNLPASTQIDLTMCSSSSSSTNSNGSTTATLSTTGVCQLQTNPMLPPTTILSADPLPDVVFKVNDFSSIRETQQFQGTTAASSGPDSQDEDGSCGYERMGGENSGGEDSTSSSTCSLSLMPGRGRGSRGRGVRGVSASGVIGGSGGRGATTGRGARGGHRLGRGASAVAKAIAMTRPRCVGGLKHTPDPERLKGLFSPSPQVFEEDTRMSADLSQMQTISLLADPQTPIKDPDFLTNDESQSSILSTSSILDPNTVPAVQHGSAIKRPKKKKMEVCVSEDADFTVASIAEYDWPPPKGCCPSKNRDTFMIQEQVALYLGIKSFKRKYPDLPRRQVDMEERNWLQEKGLVSEKLCDLGITAVWASDILDIMYTDFYEKYEEYKDYIRQKHLREIESKQKALGLNLSNGRGLQARDRAMLSTSNWNTYFNRSRKEERLACLDLQTLTVNVPLPSSSPTSTMLFRSIAETIAEVAKAESIAEPPMLLKPRQCERPPDLDINYPVAVVPGQFSAKFRQYTPSELRSFPLNTVLDDPRVLDKLLGKKVCEETEDIRAQTENSDNLLISSMCGKRLRRTRRVRGGDRLKSVNSSSSSEESSSSSGEDTESVDSDTCSSDSCLSQASNTSSEDEAGDELDICGVCQRSQHRNLKDSPELFIKCYTCCRKVHPSCIEMPHRMVGRVRSYNWQCADCKCCIKCKRKQDTNKMLFCEQCDRGFHIYCLGIKSVPDGRWSCSRCCVCVRCGATKPEGLPPNQQQISPSGEKVKQIKHKKVKWINDYRIDHITKLREHCSMLCVPCGRAKTVKRAQTPGGSNSINCGAAPHITKPLTTSTVSSTDKNQQIVKTISKSQNQMFPPAPPLSVESTNLPSSSEKSAIGGAGVTSKTLGAPPPVVA